MEDRKRLVEKEEIEIWKYVIIAWKIIYYIWRIYPVDTMVLKLINYYMFYKYSSTNKKIRLECWSRSDLQLIFLSGLIQRLLLENYEPSKLWKNIDFANRKDSESLSLHLLISELLNFIIQITLFFIFNRIQSCDVYIFNIFSKMSWKLKELIIKITYSIIKRTYSSLSNMWFPYTY